MPTRGDAEVEVGQVVVGSEADRLSERGDRLPKFPLGLQSDAEVGARSSARFADGPANLRS
jgi:hypothetical protein